MPRPKKKDPDTSKRGRAPRKYPSTPGAVAKEKGAERKVAKNPAA